MALNVRLRVISPGYAGFTGRYIDSLLHLRRLCMEREIHFHWSCVENRADIVAVRNFIAHTFEESDGTHLLMPDSDIGWDAADAMKMIDRDLPFVAAAPPAKTFQIDIFKRAVLASKPDPERFLNKFWVDPRPEDVAAGRLSVDEQGFVKVAGIASTFMLIKREVFTTLRERHPELHQIADGVKQVGYFERLMDADGTVYSEDKSFCKRWRAAGGDIHLLANATMSHTGQFTFSGNFARFAGLA